MTWDLYKMENPNLKVKEYLGESYSFLFVFKVYIWSDALKKMDCGLQSHGDVRLSCSKAKIVFNFFLSLIQNPFNFWFHVIWFINTLVSNYYGSLIIVSRDQGKLKVFKEWMSSNFTRISYQIRDICWSRKFIL